MSIFRELEKRIDERMRKLLGSREEGRELIEIQRAILDDVGAHIQTVQRGRRVFPYDSLVVTIPVEDPERRPAFEVAFVEDGALEQVIRSFLEEERCEVPGRLEVETKLAGEPMPDFAARGFHISYRKREAEAKRIEPAARATPRIRFTVLHGEAEQPEYSFERSRVNVGRLAVVVDEHQRMVRRNDVAFHETDSAPNNTVSRVHAHIQYNSDSGEFRLFDDQSAYGTSLFRDGRLVNVAPGAGRGVKLESGDELYFGQARISFEIV